MSSHRYGLECIGRTGIADAVQRHADLRSFLHDGDGKDPRSGIVADRIPGPLRPVNTSVFQNVRGGSQVR